MRKQIIILFILITGVLLAEFSEPIELFDHGFRMNNTDAVDSYNGIYYFTFKNDIVNTIMLGKTTNWEDFDYFEIYEYQIHNYIWNPVLKVKSETEVYIAFNRADPTLTNPIVTIAKTEDGGISFSLTDIGESSFIAPQLNIIDDEIEITILETGVEPLNKFALYTDNEKSENVNDDAGNGVLPYRGTDLIFGPLHSNDDIWIAQIGGGINNGWPTFSGKVTAVGNIYVYPGGEPAEAVAPMDEIFLGGYSMEVQPKIIDSSKLREGPWLYSEGDFDVCYVEINGSSADVYKGIINSHIEEMIVYSWYPDDAELANFAIDVDLNWFEDSDIIATNYVTVYDTTWVETSVGTGNGMSYFAPSDLWIKGEVSGEQTWGASGNIRIIGDITYVDTSVGNYPDGFSGVDDFGNPEYDGMPNTRDYFGLISEKNIYIAYKNYEPTENGLLETPNVDGGEDGHVHLYGSYAALGQGDYAVYGSNAPHYDGMFTFEYQHPHGSTPNFLAPSPFTGNDTTYSYIDLHKYILPSDQAVEPNLEGFLIQTPNGSGLVFNMGGYPNGNSDYVNSIPNNGPNYVYPHGTDYPWYNPVWPESAEDIVTERGTLHVFGSIAQTRKGFMHRSGSDPANHPNEDWDLENFHYAGTHPSTGYNKEYLYDRRLKWKTLNNFPNIDNGTNSRAVTYTSIDNGITFNEVGQHQLEEVVSDSYKLVVTDEIKFIVKKDMDESEIHVSTNNWQHVDSFQLDYSFNEDYCSYALKGSYLYYLYIDEIICYDLIGQEEVDSFEVEIEDDWFYYSNFNILFQGGNKIVALGYGDEINFDYTYDNNPEFSQAYTYSFDWFDDIIRELQIYSIDESEFVIFATQFSGRNTYVMHGTLDGLTDLEEESIPTAKFTLTNYPNPFNPSTEIRFTAKNAEEAKIEIYNIKGQKVKTFAVISTEVERSHSSFDSAQDERSELSVTWNGTDQNNHPVSSGIYYYTLKLDGKIEASRKMVLLK